MFAVAAFDHAYVYGDAPPVAIADSSPSALPLHEALLTLLTNALTAVGSVTCVDAVPVQPLASVRVMVYVPAGSPFTEAPVPPVDQIKL